MRTVPLLVLALLAPPLARAAPGRVVDGFDRAVVVPPAGADVVAYENDGYRLHRDADGSVRIEVSLAPLASRAPFHLAPARTGAAAGPVDVVARAVVAGARDRYEAVERLLGWVAGNVAYDLDRAADQSPARVLERRTAYCTGIARLAVALLAAVDIEAREVPGYVVEAVPGGPPAGFHRWIEVFYPDRGWVFSDPKRSHHFVPAQYMRLASEELAGDRGPALLLARENRLEIVDLYRGAPAGIAARRNDPRQLSAALKVELTAPGAGELVLAGAKRQWRAAVAGFGAATFVGLAPGEYHLQLLVDGRAAAERTLRFRAPVRASLQLSNRE